jgi:26S proteasome regulatory subunit (ATPase 3-interacting protein)
MNTKTDIPVICSNYYLRFWTLATDALPPQDATALAEDLGIEFDTDEHIAVERGPLCALPDLKRKRV